MEAFCDEHGFLKWQVKKEIFSVPFFFLLFVSCLLSLRRSNPTPTPPLARPMRCLYVNRFATSAKDNKNIEDATRFLLEKIMAAEEERAHNQTDQAVMLDRVQLSQSKVKEGCC